MSGRGQFPFGLPNRLRPARIVERAEVLLVTSYPGAWSVDWHAPPELVEPGQPAAVHALPVDVEPELLWECGPEEHAARVAQWKERVGFIEGKHGSIAPELPASNRAFRDKVVRHFLEPLGIAPERASCAAIHPLFALRKKSESDPGARVEAIFNPLAAKMGVPPGELPARLPGPALARAAVDEFGERLQADLAAAHAPLLITLGEEPAQALLRLPSLAARLPRAGFRKLYGEAYGAPGQLTLFGRKLEWLALVHPGLLRTPHHQLPAALPQGSRAAEGWELLQARWEKAQRRRRAEAGRKLREAQAPRAPTPPPAPRPPKPKTPLLPPGEGYRLRIGRARVRQLARIGLTLEVLFESLDAGHAGEVAHGRFPCHRPGLGLLTGMLLGEPAAACDGDLAARLAGKQLVADVVHGGSGGASLALVRNLRADRQALRDTTMSL